MHILFLPILITYAARAQLSTQYLQAMIAWIINSLINSILKEYVIKTFSKTQLSQEDQCVKCLNDLLIFKLQVDLPCLTAF